MGKNMNTAAVSELRSKLWSSGYKLSSNKVDDFLRYLVDRNMVDLDEDKSGEEESDNETTISCIAQQRCSSHGTTKQHQHQSTQYEDLEDLVAAMEQEVQLLETRVLQFASPSWMETEKIRPDINEATISIATSSASQDVKSTAMHSSPPRRRKTSQKSDPVEMFHKMQAIWAKQKTSRQ